MDDRIAALEQAARMGDPVAARKLGQWLLSRPGADRDLKRAGALLAQASAHGDGEATASRAVLAAVGVTTPGDWDAAVELLAQSAEQGWQPAQAQLRLLAGTAAAGTESNWQALRASAAISDAEGLAAKQRLLESPRLRAIAGFASPAECQWLIDQARARLRRASTYDIASADAVVVGARTNSEADFELQDADLVLMRLRLRIAAATGMPPEVMEVPKVLHYQTGQRFERHYDFLEPSTPEMRRELDCRGQRLVTFLLYLNDDYTGGETDFPAAEFRYRGNTGDALFFANIDTEGRPDPRSLHAGLPPTRGEKWLLSQWIRDRTPDRAATIK